MGRQRQLLPGRGSDHRYVGSPLPPAGQPVDIFDILEKYTARNLSIHVGNDFTVWKQGHSQHFNIQATLRYPVQSVQYKPGFWQMVKWGWVQYLALLVIF